MTLAPGGRALPSCGPGTHSRLFLEQSSGDASPLREESPRNRKQRTESPKTRKDLLGDWVKNNDGAATALQIIVGAASLLALSGIAPVADAGRSNRWGWRQRGYHLIFPNMWSRSRCATCTRSLVIVYDCHCITQIGVAAIASGDRQEAVQRTTWPIYLFIQGVQSCPSCPVIHRQSFCNLQGTGELQSLMVTRQGLHFI